MLDLDNIKLTFKGNEIPQLLLDLIKFQNSQSDSECYAEGFGVSDGNEELIMHWTGLEGDSLDTLNNQLFPFAQANGSGSAYVFWQASNDKPLDKAPILVLGDEGGISVIANNLKELLQLLTYDSEVMVDDNAASYYKDKEDEPSEDAEIFVEWLNQEHGINTLNTEDEVNQLIESAQAKHQKCFNEWFGQYMDL